MKLWRSTKDFPVVATDLVIRKLTVNDAERSGEVVAECFDMPREISSWPAALVGRPGWRHFGAFDGDRLVASAGLYVTRNVGLLEQAATLGEYRGRGAQGALIQRRAKLARELGCDWLVTHTAEQTPEHSAPSYRNMIRYGFTEGYKRENFLIALGGE